MKHHPSPLARKLLRRFCDITFLEEVEGDLDEQFQENVEQKGLFQARLQYWFDVIRACISGNRAPRETRATRMMLGDSIVHFFKIFFRSLRHSRTSALINVVGLVLSLMSFTVIWLYVNDELSYDEFHPNAEQTYRVSHSYSRYGDGIIETDARLPGLWIQELSDITPKVIASTRFSKFGFPGFVKYEKKGLLLEEHNVFWVDTTFTDVFSIEIMAGDEPRQVFKDPTRIIINESTARKYFAGEEPIGQEIIYSRQGMEFPFIVAGVMKDYPTNAHFHPAFIAGNIALEPLWKRNGQHRINSLGDPFTYSFVQVDDADLPKVRSIFDPIVKKHSNQTVNAVFTKLNDVHFTSGMLVELEPPGDRMYVYISASIGILILIIAAINYMNLATARSVRRSKEVGLRKALGVKRSSLARQFLGESIMTILISFVLAIGLTLALLPFFNQLTGKSFTYVSLLRGNTLLILSSVILILAILSGSYPAFYLSRFKSIDVLKSRIAGSRGAETFRKSLVVFQFTITMSLIVCAGVIRNQLALIQEGKLASNTDRVITIRNGQEGTVKKITDFRNQLLQINNVQEVSFSDHLPRREGFSFINLSLIIKSKGSEPYLWDALKVDEKFADMFKLEFVAGRNFSAAVPSDSINIILNESAVRVLGMTPQQAVGQEVLSDMNFDSEERFPLGKVIGVVKDFPYESVKLSISPMFLYGNYKNAETINVKLSPGDLRSGIDSITKLWRSIYPSIPFQYWFMDEEFDKLYRQEMQMAKLSNYFTCFAIVIACLGLFGLASFTAEQKTKEIGIRKVVGASTRQILIMLTNKFVVLVLISCLVAVPLSSYVMNAWLEGFAYHTMIHWWVFVIAGVFILLLTYVTVGIESLRAANANPVHSIRHE